MPDIYCIGGVAAPEDTQEDYALWLSWLLPVPPASLLRGSAFHAG
jgi:hypothetical protein